MYFAKRIFHYINTIYCEFCYYVIKLTNFSCALKQLVSHLLTPCLPWTRKTHNPSTVRYETNARLKMAKTHTKSAM
jgi:hypothetical protein